jgi:hypothetical protein
MTDPFVADTSRQVYRVIQLLIRSALKRAEIRPFSRLYHDTEVVIQPRKEGCIVPFLFLGVPTDTRYAGRHP